MHVACRSGRCTYPDGSSYEGDWQADERSGWGTLATADGQTYEGEWEANAPHGMSTLAHGQHLQQHLRMGLPLCRRI